MSELQTLIQRVVQKWQDENIPISPGVDESDVAAFEMKHGVTLPSDMREFYLTVNGMGDHYDEEWFFRFWPLEQITSVAQYEFIGSEIVAAIPDLKDHFLFFDHSINVFIYSICLRRIEIQPTSIRSIYPQLGAREFKSFKEFIAAYLYEPSSLLA